MSRKLDVALAEALGYEVFWVGDGRLDVPRYKSEKCSSWPSRPVRYYSTDGNDMLRLDAEMQKRGWLLDTWSETGVYALFKCSEDVDDDEVLGWTAQGHADTMPEAVALAAHHALTGKEWEE